MHPKQEAEQNHPPEHNASAESLQRSKSVVRRGSSGGVRLLVSWEAWVKSAADTVEKAVVAGYVPGVLVVTVKFVTVRRV